MHLNSRSTAHHHPTSNETQTAVPRRHARWSTLFVSSVVVATLVGCGQDPEGASSELQQPTAAERGPGVGSSGGVLPSTEQASGASTNVGILPNASNPANIEQTVGSPSNTETSTDVIPATNAEAPPTAPVGNFTSPAPPNVPTDGEATGNGTGASPEAATPPSDAPMIEPGGAGSPVATPPVVPAASPEIPAIPAPEVAQESWPQAGGVEGTWRVPGDAVTSFSVSMDENILWRAKLPSGGQGGIAVWGDTLFLTTFDEYKPGSSKETGVVLGHALSAKTGEILWTVRLKGDTPSWMMYAYSDGTSWSPITDGKHVWFFNSSGEMGCWDFAGKEVWRRKFPAYLGDKFNKQHEPFAAGDTIVTEEPLTRADPGFAANRSEWRYLRGIDKLTGETSWISSEPLTYYATSVSGRLPSGELAVISGRGGPHGVPERPVGMSLTSLDPEKQGERLWRFVPESIPNAPRVDDGSTFEALYTMTWDKDYAYAFRNSPEESHLVIDIRTGELLRTQSLIRNVDVRRWNARMKRYDLLKGVNIRDLNDPVFPLKGGEKLHVHPSWHGNLAANGYHYFTTMTNTASKGGKGRPSRNKNAPAGHSGPAYSIGRVNVETGKVEYLEVPVTVQRSPGKAEQMIYGKGQKTIVHDSNGRSINFNPKSTQDGWITPAFFPTPTVVGDVMYMTGMLGVVYVIDTTAEVLDENALLSVSDLGTMGRTWSLNSISYNQGILYHRTSQEIIAIGKQNSAATQAR